PGSGPFVISPSSALPIIAVPVTIDGTSQPGFDPGNPVPVIEVNGGGQAFDGLVLGPNSGGSPITALSIYGLGNATTGATNAGIHILTSDGDAVTASLIGQSPTSSSAAGNAIGVLIDNASSNTIGGTGADVANTIGSNVITGVSVLSGTGNA